VKSYGSFGGYRPWPYTSQAPPHYPFKYGDVFFPTKASRDAWAFYYNTTMRAVINGFPDSDEGRAAYLRMRSEREEERRYRRTDRRFHQEANAEVRKRHGLYPTGALPAAYRAEFERIKAEKWQAWRRSNS
jgi:hypothetical protein